MAYFPNGSSGEFFEDQCYDCPLGAGWEDPRQESFFGFQRELRPCPVAFIQYEFNYSQVGNKDLESAMNQLVNEKGVCQVRQQLVELRTLKAE